MTGLLLKDIRVEAGQRVLVLTNGETPNLNELLALLQQKVTDKGTVLVEDICSINAGKYKDSKFDVALFGAVFAENKKLGFEQLSEVCSILKPSAQIHLLKTSLTQAPQTKDQLVSAFKLSGFVKVTEESEIQLSDKEIEDLKINLKENTDKKLIHISASKPNYAVGSTSKLKLAPKINTKPASNATSNVWSLSSDFLNDEDVDLIDSDDLLGEEDLKKPDPKSLKVDCGGNRAKKKSLQKLYLWFS